MSLISAILSSDDAGTNLVSVVLPLESVTSPNGFSVLRSFAVMVIKAPGSSSVPPIAFLLTETFGISVFATVILSFVTVKLSPE